MDKGTSSAAGRVWMLTHEFAPFTGGIAVYLEETARAAASLGVDLELWAPGYRDTPADTFPFRLKRLPMRGKQDWICRMQLAATLRGSFPDGRIPGTLILAEPGPLRLFLYHRWLGLPRPDRLVLILHGSEIAGLGRIPHRRMLFRQLLSEADTVAVISTPVKEMLLQLCPQAADKLLILPGAVRSAWQDLPARDSSTETRLREIIQVGRIHPRKGQDQLVEAVALLPRELRQSIRVRLIGPQSRDAYVRNIRRRIRQLDLPVVLEGNLDEASLPRAYRSASMLVMPSQPYRSSIEGFGLTLIEAQHFACPVIGTRLGGIPDTLLPGQTGLLVPPKDPAALAGAIRQLLSDPSLATAMGRAGARFVRQQFSWQDNVRRLELV